MEQVMMYFRLKLEWGLEGIEYRAIQLPNNFLKSSIHSHTTQFEGMDSVISRTFQNEGYRRKIFWRNMRTR